MQIIAEMFNLWIIRSTCSTTIFGNNNDDDNNNNPVPSSSQTETSTFSPTGVQFWTQMGRLGSLRSATALMWC